MELKEKTLCYHCGDECPGEKEIRSESKVFCCEGCKMVYELINQSDLCISMQLKLQHKKLKYEGKVSYTSTIKP